MVVAYVFAVLGAIDLSILNPEVLLGRFGSIALFVAAGIIFAECGLLLGFFLPGDSLLFVVGLFVGNGLINYSILPVLLLLITAATLGNLVGYLIGKHAGPALFSRPDARLFKQSYLRSTEAFFERRGPMAIVLARFIPIARTFITVTAGASRMDFRRYMLYSTIGAVLWAGGITLLGFFFGNVPWIKNNIEAALILVVLVSVLPIALNHGRKWLRTRNACG